MRLPLVHLHFGATRRICKPIYEIYRMTQTPIRLELVAVAAGCSWNSIIRWYEAGRFPRPDLRLSPANTGWSIPTIAAHDPALADRVKRIIVALEVGG